ncbi:hypothetical protein K9U40_23345, partial [Xanthobacter autotrophicus]|uniref:hypothetical protein n=1 Tax=Xanthobacter autotrophicus TaxID=280 RepID=UPI0024AA46CD
MAAMGADCSAARPATLDEKTATRPLHGFTRTGPRAPRGTFGYIRRMSSEIPKLSMVQVLACGAAIVTLSMG